MRKLTIHNVGPITGHVKIVFGRFCVLIGPQSSGKSTIAKLLSTCMWLEKEACTTLTEDVLHEGVDFKKFVEDFHRMHGYIHPETSEIVYDSDYVTIKYIRGEYSLHLKPNNHYERIKISYIPSDRNVITMKNLEMRDLEATNFRSFLFDWLYCRKYFGADNMTDILELGVKYYFEPGGGETKDKIIHQNGATYNIPLYDASSGMQSAVPLVITTKFYTDKYFEVYDKEVSFDNEQRKRQLSQKLLEQYFPASDGKTTNDLYTETMRRGADGDVEAQRKIEAIRKHFARLTSPRSISFIIEEPEQNLFPNTQLDLVGDIIACCNKEIHQSKALITTHSPYVLAAVNILMFAGQLEKMGVPAEAMADVVQPQCVILPEDIEVYAVGNGTCYSIKDKKTGLINQNELDTASEYNAGVFDKLYRLYISKLQQP